LTVGLAGVGVTINCFGMVDVGDTRSCAGTGEDGDEDEGTVEDVGVVGGTINCAGTVGADEDGGEMESAIVGSMMIDGRGSFCCVSADTRETSSFEVKSGSVAVMLCSSDWLPGCGSVEMARDCAKLFKSDGTAGADGTGDDGGGIAPNGGIRVGI